MKITSILVIYYFIVFDVTGNADHVTVIFSRFFDNSSFYG